ncbi:uncharacterized protein Z518_06622 [Rhinocladiella mackenziei CBS 650.93]|uniref:Rhinocladiella mackenziei CBS 650.93 unplaced genomic scaffold supercont1.5, whole genome shotgun sequence n=1 Tax=Rhinocladiella mackenziei CBS 650.93 TaxID=1442369 RepID=A0A0D2FM85_9EURO|nr:uncharacterized protein Z518_06622 [Rhinocladiella mackenziei CBS 650.93]KIX03072.1 hypothetical protein Z518_06622 [Rhinocladiella mackenziei CBS 650.93]
MGIKEQSNPFQLQTPKRHRIDPTPDAEDSQTKYIHTANAMSAPPYNKLKYYTAGTPNGFKPAIVLEELGLPYEVREINFMTNEQKEAWFIEINPNGRIPALKDSDDFRVFESGAIMLYLTDMYDKERKISYEYGTRDYYEELSWLMFQMAGIGPMQGQANHFRAMAPVYSEYAIKRFVDETKRLYSVLEIRLSKADWLAGDKYTIADIANYSWLKFSEILEDIDFNEYPGVQRWMKRIADREAVQRARKVPPSGRSDEEMKQWLKSMIARVEALKGTNKDESKM